ncbi:peptidase S09 family protein [Ilumatobacter coccineus YM16-304]|uniref:Peptidase S09 family protein n=1 Tax=Ilumatobacter coccineus (strain NBRC 103263 / KCTC 29153 / YM16-304) TaxID=1313172 RepID=A0A6C7E8A5_ILUCY|nr:peptidase S09 family protein [Ilumatobacter coccineus YM16-304]
MGFASPYDSGVLDPIPLSLVQSGIDLTEPKPVPGGGAVSWVQRWGRQSAIVIQHLDRRPPRLLSHGPDPAPGRGLGGACYTWTGGGAELVYVTSEGSLWLQPSDGSAGRMVTSIEGSCRAPAVDSMTAGGTSEFVVYVVDEARVMSTSLSSGETQRLDDGRHEFCFDPCVSPDGTMVSWAGWSPPDMPWDGAVRVDCSLATGAISITGIDDAAIQQPRFAPDGRPMHVHDGSGWLNVYLGGDTVVAESLEHAGPTWGMGNRSYDVSPDGARVAFTRNEAGHGSLNVVDLSSGEVERLGRGVHGHVMWLPDGESVVALRSGARTPTQVVIYEVGGGEATRRPLAVGPNEAWSSRDLPEPELVACESSDASATLHARRFVAGEGRTICWVHGGPTDQWQVEWRPRFSYWLSRGWDILVVDPRGTTGHGREYQQALHGGWGRLDVDDTADLLACSHSQGWSSPDRTVMMGGSSGGLTVLGVLADHGHLVAGGVASYPVSDLLALTEVTHRFEAHYTDTLVGPLPESADRYTELSPIHRADRIVQPVLVFHGTDDPVVPIEQSTALVERIRAVGGDIDYVVYDGEGHGFRDPVNVADEYARTEVFLDRIVGG